MADKSIKGAIAPDALRELLRADDEIAVLDARGEGSFAQSHLLRATCLPLSQVELRAARLLPRRDVGVIWCDNGEGLAERAASRLRRFGYQRVAVLAGGIEGWRQRGYPLYSGMHVPSKAFAEVLEHDCQTPWIGAEELQRHLASNADVVVFDSRSFEEYQDNSIPTAISAPGAELLYRTGPLIRSDETLVIVNCGGRTRSIVGAQALISAELPNRVVSLKDGTMGWHLTGLPVIKGADRKAPEPDADDAQRAASAAERLAVKVGIPTISRTVLADWRKQQRSVYILDVRSSDEYLAGHMPGSISVAGGQLVQETDRWLAVWNARVVLVDNPYLVRARMTALWLRQMGWKSIAVLPWRPDAGDVEIGPYTCQPLGWSELDASTAKPIGAKALHHMLDKNDVVVIDIDSSKSFRIGHVPDAYFAVRARLPERLTEFPATKNFVLTSKDGRLARFAAAELANVTSVAVHWLVGGTDAWSAANLPLEAGLDRVVGEADDVWYTPRERQVDTEDGMRAYLEWEVALADQVRRDPDSRIELLL